MKIVFLFLFLQLFLIFELNAQLNLVEVKPGFFVHQGEHLDIDSGYHGDICNIGFIIGQKSIAVIDTGGSLKIGRKLLNEIRNRSNLPINYVINTHVHLDHIYGNAVFLDENPIFIGHENLSKAMQSSKETYEKLNLDFLGTPIKESIQIPPDKKVKINEEIIIDLGNRPLKIKAYPEAHTDSDLSILDLNTNTFWAGDLLFIERTPSIDGNIHGYISIVNEFEKADYDLVVPGHGPPTKDAKKAFLKMKHYLEKLRDEIRLAIDEGMDLNDALNILLKDEAKNWLLFDVQNKRNINKVFPEMEWE